MSRWYIIHAYSGFENKVRDAIMAEATRMGLERLVDAVEVPTEKVTGFLGSSGKPQPISDTEAARILNTKDEVAAAAPKTKIKVDFEIGDQVKVLEGPFASFNGLVEELDFDKGKVKVSVSIFGRATPVELDFEQVERMK